MTFESEVRRVADGVAEHVREAITRELQEAFGGPGPSLEKAPTDTAGGVLGAIRRMDEARTLSSVLDVVAEGHGSDSARTAVFLVAGGQMHLWKRSGSGWLEAGDPQAGVALPVTGVRRVD